ncbi:ABC-type transport auxiliary lipoprotein family protein [Phenylobacterium sp.]|jgi:cholesterol transport system auxiliary component|uniref:ABC-type transport auxiliary lipoprotein family protein n=1 Tax=Phenylobacterium sp. TaxID=1871053 RepID=UPI002E327844|nr:ABC-type transport auxiliary lipoprotein family protein [Phenylobacterium sp.]HEX4710026.1 ABC-type transport auxiliary lipoprotein family protein [Phenylobacterium sp.]
MIRPLLRLAVIGACALALSGCISLLPKSKSAQLYRFGAVPPAASAPARPNAVAVFRANGSFQGEAADDRMLTVTGGKAAYIADTRWVAPAEILFNEAVVNAFDGSPIRLIGRGQLGRSAYALRTDVRTFEVRYDSGSNAAPTVVVRLHAALIRADQSNVGEQDFEARVPATDNRVGEIVTAYNKAVDDVLGKLVTWTATAAT